MTTNKQTFVLALLLLFLTASLNSCKTNCEKHPGDPECADAEELITTLKVIVKDSATDTPLDTFVFRDADGNGVPEQFDTISLNANTAYKVDVEFWNDSQSPAENITEEVSAESENHFIVFHALGINLVFSYLDLDVNNLPVGLQTLWQTGAASAGVTHIKLRHQPGVKDGSETPGDTDVEVEFVTVIH